MNKFLSKLKNKIDSAKVVSFDIFDTLLIRPYVSPTDLFRHLELIEKVPFFSMARQEAERVAREKNKDLEDITLDHIYNEIDDIYKPLKIKELDLERSVLHSNPEMVEVFEYAKKCRKIIVIISDMYLPYSFIKDILQKNGYVDYDKLYISGEIGKTKHSGSLFEYVLSDLSVSSHDILHIGDNKRADYIRASQAGMRAVLYPKVVSQFLKEDYRGELFRKESGNNIGASILITMMAWRWQQSRLGLVSDDTYWSRLGYMYAGPVSYGYCRFVEKTAGCARINNLLFVARDGYVLQKIFNTFVRPIKSSYLYAPRFLNLICRLDYNKHDTTQARSIVDFFREKSREVRMATDGDDLVGHDLISKYKEEFYRASVKEFDKYKRYISKFVESDDVVGVVDTITSEFSSQRLVQGSLKADVYGIYWGIAKVKAAHVESIKYNSFVQNDSEHPNGRNVFTANWNFIEFLITSPEYPVKNIDENGTPIYDSNPSKYEIERAKLYPFISDAAILFSTDVRNIFDGRDIFLSNSILIKWVNIFIDNPNRLDIREMSKVFFGIDSGHKDYVPLFSQKIPLRDVVFCPIKSLKIVKRLKWRTIPQTIAICMFSPLKISIRGLKKIEIIIFPRLNRRYFTIELRPIRGIYYRFVVGNVKDSV